LVDLTPVPRYFTLDQARQLLTAADRLLRQTIALKQEHEHARDEIDNINRKVSMMGGMYVDRENYASLRAKVDSTATRLKEIFSEIEQVGFEVKDLDIGLIDFPTLYRGEEVCLCWKLGEADIEFWHGTTEGFRGRKPIDQEFLEQHRGDYLG
jgi:hypothetical protein